RRRPEHEGVAPGLEAGRELGDPSVGIGLAGHHDVAVADELDPDARGRPAGAGVEDMCRHGDAHAENLCAWARWARAISASSALTSAPPRTTSSPSTTS